MVPAHTIYQGPEVMAVKAQVAVDIMPANNQEETDETVTQLTLSFLFIVGLQPIGCH